MIFEQPESYSVDRPIVKMNGRSYKIFKRSAGLTFGADPRSIMETLKNDL